MKRDYFEKSFDRLDKILTFTELIQTLQAWNEAFPERGNRPVMVEIQDSEMGTYHVGVLGVSEAEITSTFFPPVKIMQLDVEK